MFHALPGLTSMRPATTFACLLLAAASGAAATRLLTPSAADPTPVRTLAEQTATLAADAALPAKAVAATPAPIPGSPIPSLAPMLERVTPAVVNITTKQVVRVNNPIADFFGGGRIPRERISQSLGSGVIVDATRGLILTKIGRASCRERV